MHILDIKVQKLFAIALALKLVTAFLSWRLQSPWILGFVVPLAIMGAYIGLGSYRRDKSVSDEKFADTCYYLGFIFTIASIILSLFDLPNIGTRIEDIAVRFGAAMVSTVLGLGVRVYLVSFRTDVADAIKDTEDALLDASRRFIDQLSMALERLRDFESRVDIAARSSVERVNLQVETLSKNHADKLGEFFQDLTARNQDAFTTALAEVKTASLRLSQSVDGYATGMRGNLTSIEAKVTAFAEAVTTRLQNTTFPDDYFSRQLAGPLSQLEGAATDIAERVGQVCGEIERTTASLASSLKQVKLKSTSAEAAMDTVLQLTEKQKLVLDAAEGQTKVLEGLSRNLTNLDTLVNNAIIEVSANSVNSRELAGVVARLAAESAAVRTNLEGSLTALSGALGTNASANAAVANRLDATVSATERLITQMADGASAQMSASAHLEASARVATQVAAKYTSSVELERGAVQALVQLSDRADKSLFKMADAASSLQSVARDLAELTQIQRSARSAVRPATPVSPAPSLPDIPAFQAIQPALHTVPAPAPNPVGQLSNTSTDQRTELAGLPTYWGGASSPASERPSSPSPGAAASVGAPLPSAWNQPTRMDGATQAAPHPSASGKPIVDA